MPSLSIVLGLLAVAGWIVSAHFSYTGGARGKTEERLTHPIGLSATVICALSTLGATISVGLTDDYSFAVKALAWIPCLILVIAEVATPFIAFDEGHSDNLKRQKRVAEAVREEEKRVEQHAEEMASLRHHHAELEKIRNGSRTA